MIPKEIFCHSDSSKRLSTNTRVRIPEKYNNNNNRSCLRTKNSMEPVGDSDTSCN